MLMGLTGHAEQHQLSLVSTSCTQPQDSTFHACLVMLGGHTGGRWRETQNAVLAGHTSQVSWTNLATQDKPVNGVAAALSPTVGAA